MEYVNRGEKEQRHRFIIITDLENEPDDSQTMVRLLMYSNELDIEGLVASTSCWLQFETYPESIYDRVKAYGVVRNSLMSHAQGWPTEAELLSMVVSGQTGFGMNAVGDGKNTSGSERIIAVVDRDDPRPVYFAINAGANTLAQALWDVRRTRSASDLARFIGKIRVYDDAGQDNAGAWICHNFPDLFYIRSKNQVFALYGPSMTTAMGPQPWGEPMMWKDDLPPTSASIQPMNQWKWIETHIRRRHGILGALYPQRVFENGSSYYMEGGGSTCVVGLINKGLYDPTQISWGGWGGRFSLEKVCVTASQKKVVPLETRFMPFMMYPQAADTWRDGETLYENNEFAPVFRWRVAYTNDFKARMDWCVTGYGQANHHPVASFYGDNHRSIVQLRVSPGETVTLDASASFDPDGDKLSFSWINYAEAGSYGQDVEIQNAQDAIAQVVIPQDAIGKTIHVILQVSDNNSIASLTSYRRIVMTVVDTDQQE